jgi:hypothetical protein
LWAGGGGGGEEETFLLGPRSLWLALFIALNNDGQDRSILQRLHPSTPLSWFTNAAYLLVH